MRILLVDDDPVLVSALQSALQQDGHQVTAADDGRGGITAFMDAQTNSQPFEVVITDLGMPQMDGRQVAVSIKQLSPDTPVILLTGWGKGLLDDCVGISGVDYVLSKPPRTADLRATLAKLGARTRTIRSGIGSG